MCYGLLYKHKYCFQFYVFCASWKINKNMTIPMIIDCESHFGDYFLLSLYDRTNLFKAVFWIITHKAAANRNRLHKKKNKKKHLSGWSSAVAAKITAPSSQSQSRRQAQTQLAFHIYAAAWIIVCQSLTGSLNWGTGGPHKAAMN